MTRSLVVDVIGTPAPQGSKRHVGRGVMVESSKMVAPWRDSVAWAVRATALSASWTAIDGPVRIEMTFRLARPQSAPKSRIWPDRKPDIDKLVRSTLDAITTAGVIADDARVVELAASKVYAGGGRRGPVGATIQITSLAPLSGVRPNETTKEAS